MLFESLNRGRVVDQVASTSRTSGPMPLRIFKFKQKEEMAKNGIEFIVYERYNT